MAQARIRLLISGRVQRVGFRAFVAREASALGLAGYVRNLRDGRVEAEFAGENAAVEAIRRACGRGPAAGRAEIVEEAPPGDGPLPRTFEVRRDG